MKIVTKKQTTEEEEEGKKKLNSSFPGVDKLNREGNKRASSNRKSPKIS